VNTKELMQRLERHYIKPGAPLPGGIFLPEVGWNNGGGQGGCDAIYVGFTSTSGRVLTGHELKVSRADWVKEMESPGKADAWADQCHQWYLVVSDPDIVREGELPPGWGLMVPNPRTKTRMDVKVRPEHKLNHDPSWLAVRSIMARQDTLRAQAIMRIKQDAVVAARAEQAEALEKARAAAKQPDEHAAILLWEAIRKRGHWLHFSGTDDYRFEETVDAMCNALDGINLKRNVENHLRGKLRDIERAMSELRESPQLKNLLKELVP
jgi:hypothetical protein